jgi:type IV secretory pathway VirD2 relaxase
MSRDNQFNVRLGRILSPNGTGRFVSFSGQVRRAAQRSSRSLGRPSRKQGAIAEQYFSRRVIVKVHLVKMGAYGKDSQRHHLNYIQRDSAAREGETGLLYSRDEVMIDGDEFRERGLDDRHQFRVIVSPEDGKEFGDLRTYTRNVMAQMERDLGTKLDWVAANHYDTANPHSHVVIRGVTETGSTLIIPRDYISHGMREAAEHVATLELGPTTQIDVAKKLALSVRHDRFTSIDRDLLAKGQYQIVDLSKLPLDGSDWSQRFEKWRVKYLSSLGLAEKMGFGKWRLDDNLERTLRRMGDRGDILKAYHRAMSRTKLDRSLDSEPIYDPAEKLARPITGRVIEKGVLDDVNDRSYIVLDTLQGEALFVETGKEANLAQIERGMVVTAGPQTYAPKASDLIITDIASKRGGIYSPSFHEMNDPGAREEFIKAHVRRLEAMRRAGHAERNSDGSWNVPKDYLKRVVKYETSRSFGNPVKLDIQSRAPLAGLTQTIGKTWLDTELMKGGAESDASGFGQEVETLKTQRQKFLLSQKLIERSPGVTQSTLDTLEQMDLDRAGKEFSEQFGKLYKAAPASGRISGIYLMAIQRPSGKYAVIEKSKEFTLVPWRSAIDRNLGKSISGVVKGQTISWTLTKARGKSIS